MRAEYASLMARYQAGDAQAFETLYRELAAELPQIVRSLAPDVTVDDRLLGEIFLDIHGARRSYHPRHPFEPWLRAVARHTLARQVVPRRRLFGDLRARLFTGNPRDARPAA